MEIYKGTATFSGIAIGKILVLQQRGIPDTSVSGQQHQKRDRGIFSEAPDSGGSAKLNELYEANRLSE